MLIDIPYMISSQIDLIKAGGYGGQSFPGLHDGVVSMAAFSAPPMAARRCSGVNCSWDSQGRSSAGDGSCGAAFLGMRGNSMGDGPTPLISAMVRPSSS
ncbi:MAG: hypothetical protein BHW35_06215 [Firmicutes bacterium CAG:176_63_11]|nr:MAG: hypothetical protein BHW35_06215 [Firmicutes bacterium CAG:176_63_11]